MTRYEPSLSLSRLAILKAGIPVYNERFHLGVNVIRGENSTGKSSIANMIFYILGGEAPRWTDAVLQCDTVIAEVLLNGAAVTIRREISTERGRPLSIYWAKYDEAMGTAFEGWQTYPYAKTKTRQSFSSVLYRALTLPEVRGAMTSNLTMHQLLRLMYIDQLTPPMQLFRDDGPFDKPAIREAVGAILCGVYDARIFDIQRELQAFYSDRDALERGVRAVFAVLSDSNQAEDSESIEAKIAEQKEARNHISRDIEQLRQRAWEQKKLEHVRKAALEEIARQLQVVKQELREVESELSNLEYEIEDSELFVAAIRKRVDAVDDSEAVSGSLGSVSFSLCPACFAPVEEPEAEGKCPLCKASTGDRSAQSQILRLRQEMSLQIDESRMLQLHRQERKSALVARLPSLRERAVALQARYDAEARDATTAEDAALAEKYRALGGVETYIEGLQRRLQLALSIEKLQTRQRELAGEIARLEEELEQRRVVQQRKEFEAHELMQRRALEILREDLPREEAFVQSKSFTFSFEKDSMAVDGHSNFSASSLVVLKNTLHLALLAASLEMDFFRYPRFALFDNVEDKGMEPARSHKFQENILAVSDQLAVEHQIIFTTSMVSPALDRDPYVVGPTYTHDRKVLQL